MGRIEAIQALASRLAVRAARLLLVMGWWTTGSPFWRWAKLFKRSGRVKMNIATSASEARHIEDLSL